jgi:hypothetical protein
LQKASNWVVRLVFGRLNRMIVESMLDKFRPIKRKRISNDKWKLITISRRSSLYHINNFINILWSIKVNNEILTNIDYFKQTFSENVINYPMLLIRGSYYSKSKMYFSRGCFSHKTTSVLSPIVIFFRNFTTIILHS